MLAGTVPAPDLSRIAREMVNVVAQTGDDVHLVLGATDEGRYSASLMFPIWGSGFAPLFDPVNGVESLVATGETPAAALAALAAKLTKHCG